jgi:hypothetical protein
MMTGAMRTTAIIASMLLAVAVGYSGPPSFELFDYDPVANPKAVVTSGQWRSAEERERERESGKRQRDRSSFLFLYLSVKCSLSISL